jgi:DNA-directed RNA polymerase specialized sigma24 family protein
VDADNAVAEATAAPRQETLIVAPNEYVTFFRERYRLLVAYAVHVGANHDEADEVTYQTLQQMLTSWDRITDPLPCARKAVVRNLITLRRNEQARMIRQGRYAVDTFERPADGLRSGEDGWETVRAHLALLTPSQRVVVEHLLRGCTQTEIALLLGRSHDAIRSTLADIRRRLAPIRPQRTRRSVAASGSDSSAHGKEDQ